MRRAAVSIPSNIAEGYGRRNKAEYRHFLYIAYSSLLELETQFLLSVDLKYIGRDENIKPLIEEVGKILYRMLHPLPKT
jgi:four helix bundle protein